MNKFMIPNTTIDKLKYPLFILTLHPKCVLCVCSESGLFDFLLLLFASPLLNLFALVPTETVQVYMSGLGVMSCKIVQQMNIDVKNKHILFAFFYWRALWRNL